MIVDTLPRAAVDVDLADWSAAEFLDAPQADGLALRALICRLGAGKWQWSITSLDGDSGALICAGLEKTIAEARETAASELVKCLENPIVADGGRLLHV
jgi:hypothetical protein